MLTTAQLAVLITYRWDFQRFENQASSADKQLMHPVDWAAVGELLQDLRLYHRGFVAPDYAAKTLVDLRQVCADTETAQLLIGYASTL